MRRGLSGLVAAVALVVGSASPAAAHGESAAAPTNWVTTLDGFSAPAASRLSLRVVDLGERLELTNRSDEEAVVLGYEGEPYLRVGANGAWGNARSPAYYLNRSLDLGNQVPPQADPTAEPDWRRLSGDRTVRWHDHRSHWMGANLPPQVERAPGRVHVVIPEWKVEVRQGGTTHVASGAVTWRPPPPLPPWIALTVGAFLAGSAISLAGPATCYRLLAIAVVVLVLVNGLHLAGSVVYPNGPLTGRLSAAFEGALAPAAAWVTGLGGAHFLWRRRLEGVWYGLFGCALIAVLGIADLGAIIASQLPTALPFSVARATACVAVGFGAGALLSLLQLLRVATRAASATDGATLDKSALGPTN